MREPIEFRQPAALRIYAVCFGIFWVGSLLWFGVRSPSDLLITALFIVVGLAIIAANTSIKFVADESALHVRNFVRMQHFRWDEVEDFRLGRPAWGPFGYVIHALLRNGEVVTLSVTASHWGFAFGGKAKREQLLQSLREWLPPRD